MKTILLILSFSFAVSAQALQKSDFLKPQLLKSESTWRSMGPMTAISGAVCFSGTAADIGTSGGFNERTGFYRNPDGSPNKGRAALVEFGSCGGTLLVEHFYPKAAKVMSVLRFAMGGIRFGVAVHNRWGVRQ